MNNNNAEPLAADVRNLREQFGPDTAWTYTEVRNLAALEQARRWPRLQEALRLAQAAESHGPA